MEDIERELGLTRDDLIRSALLLGSDYTEGVTGIGPVNAMEVLTTFPGDDGLVSFREWLHSVDPEPKSRKSKPKAKKRKVNSTPAELDDEIVPEADDAEEAVEDEDEAEPNAARRRFQSRHKAARRNWVVADGFPSRMVLAAYRAPTVTHCDAPFEWRAPDFDGIRSICHERFGWDASKTNAELGPLVRAMSSPQQHQTTLESFVRLTYAAKERAARIKSTRLAAAVKKRVPVVDDDLTIVSDTGKPSSSSKRKRSAAGTDSEASTPATSQ
jgi:DNA excision repair protein ERCC-5